MAIENLTREQQEQVGKVTGHASLGFAGINDFIIAKTIFGRSDRV